MPPKRKVKRLFIDPGSHSTGWAFFLGKTLESHGTVVAPDRKRTCFFRIGEIYLSYFLIGEELKPDEVHFENFRKNLAIGLHHSVGAIGAALALNAGDVKQDCWMGSWQKFHGYSKKLPLPKHLEKYEKKCESQDELEAIAIGLWYVERKV